MNDLRAAYRAFGIIETSWQLRLLCPMGHTLYGNFEWMD